MAVVDSYAVGGVAADTQNDDYPLDDVIQARVVADYDPCGEQADGKLKLRRGELVYVLERHPSGWWGGHKEDDDHTAWFPASHVQIIAGPESSEAAQQQVAFDENACNCSPTTSSNPLFKDHRAIAMPMRGRRVTSQDTELAEATNLAVAEACKEFDRDRARWNKERRHLEEIVNVTEQERLVWSEERRSLLEQLGGFERERAAWYDERQALQEQVSCCDKERKALLEERHAMQDRISELQRQVQQQQALQFQLRQKEERLVELESRIQALMTPSSSTRAIESASAQKTNMPSPRRSSPVRSARALSTGNPSASASPVRSEPGRAIQDLPTGRVLSSALPQCNAGLRATVATLEHCPMGSTLLSTAGSNPSRSSLSAVRPVSLGAPPSKPTATPIVTPPCTGSQARTKSPPMARAVATSLTTRPPSPRPWAFAAQTVPAVGTAVPSGRESPARAAPSRSGAGTPPAVRTLVSVFERPPGDRRGRQCSAPTPAAFGPSPSFPPRGTDPSPGRQVAVSRGADPSPGRQLSTTQSCSGMAPLVRCNSSGRGSSFELRAPGSAVVRQHSRGAAPSPPVPGMGAGQVSKVQERIRQFSQSR